MQQLADDLYHLPLMPRNGVNAYFAGGVLFDAGTSRDAKKILRALRGHTVTAHALTHAHPDHQGASHAVCETLGIPLWCGTADADAMTSGDLRPVMPDNWLTRVMRSQAGPAHPVDRYLKEGDEVGGFTVIETPGHSPGHVVYWRERGRTLILGDVLNGMNLLTTIPGLREPPTVFTPNPAQNRASARKLAGLAPNLVVFGHGPPLRDPARFRAFISSLAA
ncbi:MAG: MBL fold metallo-hydrolase [Rhodothermales bacterium]